ncbi:penicillin acylase family protein [Pseudoxanthomonas beigongshangi]
MQTWIRRIALLVLALSACILASAWWVLRDSLPRLEGRAILPGLQAPATIQRDALGVVTIDAANENDAMRALGYVHAQERYFEMDLMRRNAAGELAELFGPAALARDRKHRVHRLRARLGQHLDDFIADRRIPLQAYTDGVNGGLGDLRARPWPYLLLRQAPRRWEIADSALTGYAMYFDLQDAGNERELALWRIRQQVPPALYDLLSHDGSSWDAPMFGQARGDALLPSAAQLDLRKLPAPPSASGRRWTEKEAVGSNNWAVGGALTADGRAIVADDMHLALRAPNLWFRVRLRYPDPRAAGGRVDVSGVSLPGLPAIVAGSNGHVAWGFTNSYADTADWYPVHPCTPASAVDCEPVQHHRETLRVAGADPVTLEIRETRQGPILHDARGRFPALALRWVAHQPGALNVHLADFARVGDLPAALAVAGTIAIPAQNLILADRQGRIAWRITGPLAQRAGACPSPVQVQAPVAAPAAEGCMPWRISTTLVAPFAQPPSHRLWTANARVLDGETLATAGDGGYALGARAQQIRDRLFARERFDERDLLAIQLDDRALFLHRWWQLLQREAERAGDGSALHALGDAGRRWEGRASVDSVSYRLVQAWRQAVHARIAEGLVAPARAALGDDFLMPDLPQLEGVVWPLLQTRPVHLLPRSHASWDALLEDAAAEVRAELAAEGPLETRRWGEHNTSRICHPMANALPAPLQFLLCMPQEPLPGDGAMPRVQHPSFGASERMVVSPGREADGFLHMPGGQSGHPMSPFWGAGHQDWVHGRPTPFLPGPPRHTLVLAPR